MKGHFSPIALLIYGGLAVLGASEASAQLETPRPAGAPAPEDGLFPDRGAGWIDLGGLEAGFHYGQVVYGANFSADPAPLYGLFLRAPLPWTASDPGEQNPPEVNPFEWGFSIEPPWMHVGVFAQIIMTSMERSVAALADPEGDVMFAGGGLDIRIIGGKGWVVRGQVGAVYADFGGVSDTESGSGLLLGLSAGVHLSPRWSFSYTAQLTSGDGDNRIGLHHLGIEFSF